MNVTDLIKLINSDEYTVSQELGGIGEVSGNDSQGFWFTGEYSEGTTHEQGGMDGQVSEYISLGGTRSISVLYDFDDNEITLSESQFKTVTDKIISRLWD